MDDKHLGWRIMIGVSASTITTGMTSETGTSDIEVFVPELAPNGQGKPVENPDPVEFELENPLEKTSYKGKAPKADLIKCQYMGGNNVYVPCVYPGEQVWVLQYEGGQNSFYWLPIGRDEGIRLREHLRWFAMNQPDAVEGTNKFHTVSEGNTYYVDINTNKGEKVIRLHTCINDGEPHSYDLEFIPEQSLFRVYDNVGNILSLDSANTVWRMFNISGSYVELNKTDITIFAPNNITIQSGNNILVQAGSKITETAPQYLNTSVQQIQQSTTWNVSTSTGSISAAAMSITAGTLNLTGAITCAGANFTVASASGIVPVIIVYGSNVW